jgi:hypothetical protein
MCRKETTVNDVARSVPRIYAVVENRQADHQASVVELEGIITNQPISILIDPGSNLSYISPRVVEACSLQRKKHARAWLVQLATGTKRKVVEVIEACPIEMNGLQTQEALNILPLGSYDVLLGMDWLASHKEKLNCYEKVLECEDNEGNARILQGIQKPVSVRKISTLQLKKFNRKGCPLYAIQVLNSTESKEMKVEDHPVLWEFKMCFQRKCLDYLRKEILIFQ